MPLLWVGACGDSGSGDDAGTTATDSSSREAGVDLDTPGDDLLSESRWGGPVPGDTVEGSWRFPKSYEPTGENVPNNEAISRDGDSEYRIVIGAIPGREEVEEVDQAAKDLGAKAEAAGQTVALKTLSIGGREFVEVTQEDGGTSRRNLFHAPEQGRSYFLVVLEAPAPVDETPPKRLQEYYQTAASLEFKSSDG